MSSINFDNVWVFYLAIPLAIIILVPFILAIRKDNLNWHNVVSLVLHLIIATLVLFAASGVKTETVLTKTSVYVVADVSYSANRNFDRIDNHINNVKNNLPKNSQMGVVCFAKDYELLTGLGEEIRSVSQSSVDDSETNVSQAVEFASSLFPEEGVKRIVIISDGKSTYSSDSLRSTVNSLVARGIYVDAIYIDDNLDEDLPEVQISAVEVASAVLKDKASNVKISIESNKETSFSQLNLYKKSGEDYELFASTMISLFVGQNTVEMALDSSKDGIIDYKIEIKEDDDLCDVNNTYYFTQQVTSALKVLVYHGNEADFASVSSLYDENTTLVGSNVFLDNNIPFDIGELSEYDEIVICDVDLSKFSNYEILLSNIETVVSSFGKSLVTFGNLGVQAPSAGIDSMKILDDMLPVRFGTTKDLPKMYALVIDTSLSMSLDQKMFIAKDTVKMLLSLMSDDDYVYVGGFSGEIYTLQTPTKVSECREKLIEKIENFDFRQGTLIGAALLDTLRKVNDYKSIFSNIQVTLITDGKDYKMGSTTTPIEAAQRLNASNIPTSVILVRETKDEIVSDMRQLAFEGGGSFYHITDSERVSDVILKEYISKETETEVSDNTWVSVNKPRDKVLNGVDTTAIFVSYFVVSVPRARANTILTVDYDNVQVPLYAYWNYGNGRVSVYTGRVNGLRANESKGNTQGTELVNKLLFGNVGKTATPDIFNDVPFMVSHNITDKTATLTLTPVAVNHTSAGSLAKIKIIHPEGKVENATLNFVQDSYTYSFDLSEIGKYTIEYSYEFEGKIYYSTKYICLSYKPEYNMFEHFDKSALFTAVASTGEVIDEGVLKFDNSNSEVETRTLSLVIYLLIISAVFYVIDIAIRRLKWNDIVSFFFGSSYKQRRVKNDREK